MGTSVSSAGRMAVHENVADYLLADKENDQVALYLNDRQYTYADLSLGAQHVAGYLSAVGVKKGDRVLLVSDNSFFWVAAYLGILKAGLVCVPLTTVAASADLDYILRTTEAKIAFVQAGFAVKHSSRLAHCHLVTDREVSREPSPANTMSFATLQAQVNTACNQESQTCADDLAALMFTSGSTGKPRGVMVSHSNIIANTDSIIQYLALTEHDRIMAVLPFHYCFGTSLLHTHLRVGGSLVIDLRFMYPEKILQRMLETECTGFAGVPSHFQILLRNSSLRQKQFPHLRYVQQAGGHLAPGFIRDLREALPGTKIFIMYGQTEATARLSYLPPEFLDTKLGSIGKGIPGVRLQVLSDTGAPVRPGEVGQIVAQGKNVSRGYWNAPQESANSFRNGQLFTGDLATVDEDGFIFVVDRAKDFVKCGGKRVSSRHLEDQLLEFEEVIEAAVIGVPDDVLGEAVKAFVVPRVVNYDGLQERLQLFCKRRIPPEFIPKEIVVLRTLPKNSSGKVLKQELRESAADFDEKRPSLLSRVSS